MAEEYSQFGDDARALYSNPNFFADLSPITGAIEAINQLDSLGLQVIICSSPITSYQNCVEEKYRWVDKNLGPKWIDRLILTRDKTLIHGDILIDDRPHVTGSINPSWEHVIFEQPYNKDVIGKRRLNWQNYREVLGIY